VGRFIGLSIILLGIYAYLYPHIWKTEQVRYRVSVSISTPSGDKTGSGVWGYSEAPRFDVPVYSMRWSYSPRLEGEAFPIDLGNGNTAYAVIGQRDISTQYGVEGIVVSFRDRYLPFEGLRKAGLGHPEYVRDEWDGARARVTWLKAQKGITVPLDCVPALHRNTSSDCPALVQVTSSQAGPRFACWT
jgi:hypothetical protein